MILCKNMYGEEVLVPKEKLTFRPSAYAIIVRNQQMLLVNTRSTGKYFFPGGAVELGERLEAALKREVREETGLEIEVGELFQFKENFFYNNPADEAYHTFAFVFLAQPASTALIDDALVEDGEAEKPRWVNIKDLQPDDFQSFAAQVFAHFQANIPINDGPGSLA
jgi:mutator protein MutT